MSTFNTCKFGEKCAFKHAQPKSIKIDNLEIEVAILRLENEELKKNTLQTENEILKLALEDIKETVNSNNHKIKELLQKVVKLETKHSNDINHPFNQCGKPFVSNENLSRHMAKYHTVEMLLSATFFHDILMNFVLREIK